MYRIVFSVFTIILLASMPIASAQETRGVLDHVRTISYNIISVIKTAVLGVEVWFIRYILGDYVTANRISFEIKKERAYNAFNNDRFRDSDCCRSHMCYIEQSDACITVCQDCDDVETELNNHFGVV